MSEEERQTIERLQGELRNRDAIICQLRLASVAARIAATLLHDLQQHLCHLRYGLDALLAPRTGRPSTEEATLGVIERYESLQDDVAKARAVLDGLRASRRLLLSECIEIAVRAVFRRPRRDVEFEVQRDAEYKDVSLPGGIVIASLQEVLLNSVQALETHSGPGRVEVAVGQTANEITITVKDNGPGILPEHQERIWDAGFTTSSERLGLGLFVVKNLLSRVDGEICLDTCSRGGTQFTMKIRKDWRVRWNEKDPLD